MNLKCITTTYHNDECSTTTKEIPMRADSGIEREVINLYPQIKAQIFDGFGGAFTDSAGYVYSLMKEEQKQTMIERYFGTGADDLRYRLGRMHIDSCDFSLEHYEAMSDASDTEMKSFSLERTAKYILPLLHDVQAYMGQAIELMITPWSPPAFMKSNKERNNGGILLDEYKQFWAEYMCRYIKELRIAGCKITCLSLQNEPKAVQTWDSCVYTVAEERTFLKDFLYPELVRNGLDDIDIYIWDHNKERLFERACGIIDEATNHMVAGVAFHWYGGDHFEAVRLVHELFPDKKLVMSEACIEYALSDSNNHLLNAQKYAHDIIGNLNAGMTAFYDWNLILDQDGGPNHVKNYCDAPYIYDINKQSLKEQNTLKYLWHFSHFIDAGARKIGFSRYTDDIEVTALENLDGTLVMIAMNQKSEAKTIVLRVDEKEAIFVLPGKSIMTSIISK
jgi:O-Glycosyl hydrolase